MSRLPRLLRHISARIFKEPLRCFLKQSSYSCRKCATSLGSPFLIHSGNVIYRVCKYWVFKSFFSHHVKAGLYIAENGRGVDVISFSRSRNDHGKKTEILMKGTNLKLLS